MYMYSNPIAVWRVQFQSMYEYDVWKINDLAMAWTFITETHNTLFINQTMNI